MGRRNAAASTSVEDKLRELGVDEEGEQLDEQEDESDDEESDDEEEDDEEHDDDEEDDESTSKLDALAAEPEPRLQPATKRSKLRDALFADATGPRPSRPAPPRAPSTRTSEPSPLPLEREDPVYVVPPPRMRKTKQEASPGVKRLGPALAKKLPGAERIKIRKRMENGQLGLVGEYSIQDLAASSDVESFIFKHIKPKFGAGIYKLTGIDAAGNELDAGEIPILEPEHGGANDPLSVMAQMFERQAREAKEMMEQRMAGNPDPVGMLKGLQEVQQNMAAQVPLPKDTGSDFAAMMTMMMQMQAQQAAAAQAAQNQMTQLLVTAMQPREDPVMKALLAKLVEDKTTSGGGSSMPLPPMPPPTSPFEGMKEMMEVLVMAMGGNKKDSGDAELKELVKAALSVKKEETLSPRDWIQLMREVQTTKSDDDSTFRKSMEHMGMVLQVATNLRSQTEGSGSATFFDALSSLFSNRDFAGSIAQSIRAKSETAAQSQLLAQQQQLIREKQALVNQLRARGPQQPVVAAPPQGNVVQMHRPPAAPVPPVPVAAPAPVAPVAAPPPAAVTEAAAEAVETAAHAVDAAAHVVELAALSQAEVANDNNATPAPATKAPKIPPLPVATYEHINGIVAAKDDGTLIQNTVRMLIYFAEFPDWRPLTEMLLGMVQAGEKRRATKALAYIFQGLSAMGMLAPAQSDRIIKAFVEHFDDIQQGISDLPLAEEERNAFTDVLDDTDEDEEEEEDEDEDEDDEEDQDEDEDEDDEEDEDDAPGMKD